MKNKKYLLVIAMLLVILALGGCGSNNQPSASDDLNFESWNADAASLSEIKSYVEDVVTDPYSEEYIPSEDRIAVFDMDGTLYGEKAPIYIEWLMYVYRTTEDPNYTATSEQIEVANKITEAIETGVIPEELELEHAICNAQVYAGMTIDEYTEYVKNFVSGDVKGFTGAKYADMWYKPMVEVVDYLIQNDFTVYICSGTDRFMCRALADGKVDINPEHVIGMDVFVDARDQGDTDGLEYEYDNDDVVVRTDQLIIKNVKANKVSQIQQEIGRKPVLSFGNSSGDTSMARFVVDDNPYKSAAFMVVADDTVRDNGDAQKAAEISKKWADNGFITISMKNDWKTIYGEGVMPVK